MGRHPVLNDVCYHTIFTGVLIDELCTWRCHRIGLIKGHAIQLSQSGETAPLWRERKRYITGHEER